MLHPSRSLWLMFIWLALGYGVVHGVLGGWIVTLVMERLEQDQLYEQVQLTKDAEPLIQISSRQRGRFGELSYRKLDGTPVSASDAQQQVANGTPINRPGTTSPTSWHSRLNGVSDLLHPAGYWYAIWPPETPGRMYFAGFSSSSRRPIGFLGTDGFSASPPAEVQRFAVGPTNDRSGVFASVQGEYLSFEPMQPALVGVATPFANVPDDAVWVKTDDGIYEIRLATTSAKRILDADNIVSFARFVRTRDKQNLLMLLVRMPDALLIVDPGTGEQEALPHGFSQSYAMYLESPSGRKVIHESSYAFYENKPIVHRFTWYDNGQSETKELTTARPQSPGGSTLAIAVAVPSPIVPIAVIIVGPIVMASESHAYSDAPQNYVGRFAYMAWTMSGWLAATVAIGLFCGWLCRRREVALFHNRSWMWPVVVGVVGLPGWMAYRCLRARPVPARELVVPLGIEVFA
jgi:hypothetical protein